MEPDSAPAGLSAGGPQADSELRRNFHDRIAALRSQSLAIVDDAAQATADATATLVDPETTDKLADIEAARAAAPVSEVEAEVLALLALQGPVARDLRIILTSRDIAQLGELCLGLCVALAKRAPRVREVLTPALCAMLGEVGDQAASLLREANAAWSAIDPGLAEAVIGRAQESRELQVSFFTELVGLRDIPLAEAVNLGLASRVYERLVDHAVDIGRRVIFAATGAPPGQSRLQLEG